MLKLDFISILVMTLMGYSVQQHSPHSIRIERNTNWPTADHEFAKRLPTWSQEVQHFLKSLENTHQLTSSDIRMVYGRCARSPKHLNAHQVENSAYIINQSEFCVRRPQMKLLIVVHSHPSNTHRRHLIRSTWASMRRVALEQIATMFFLGRATSEAQQQKIEEENQLFQDIVQRNFTEDYHNLTHKHLTVLEWLSTGYCSSLDYVVKVDDDTFVDPFHLVRFLRTDRMKPGTGFYCTATTGAKPIRPGADVSKNKWTISNKEFGKTVFPTYCEGLGYIIEAALAPYLYLCSMFAPPIWIDDVYVTGILAELLGIQRYEFLPGHGYDRVEPNKPPAAVLDSIFLTCYYSEYLPETFRRLWRDVVTLSMNIT